MVYIKKLSKPLLALVAAFLLLIGCSPKERDIYYNAGKRLKFGATYMNMNNPFFVKLNNGIKKVAESKNGKLITLDAQLDIDKQIEQVSDLIAQKVDVIFLNPIDWKKIKPALESAKKANIPVIVVDSPVYDDSLVESTIVSDNYDAGVLCANDMIQRLNGKGEIVILEHPNAKSSIDRIEGFENTLRKCSTIKVAMRSSSNGQLELAMEAMEIILTSGNKFGGVMCLNDPTALGAIAALENTDQSKNVLVYGIDGSEDAMRMIQENKLTATVAQFPERIGKTAGETALKKLQNEKIEHFIKVPVALVNKSNLGDYYEK